ncbi:hypothetical protein [Streptomyces lydicus]|uniref:hypothetical protein n=1 Tax=Streptomyces lydicus TaxID=47763 RepID=UPI0013E343B2|nr:hypothetical protein [Streptomyces lydicus]
MQKMTPDNDGRAGKATKTGKGRGLRGPLLKVGVPLAVCGALATGIAVVAFSKSTTA